MGGWAFESLQTSRADLRNRSQHCVLEAQALEEAYWEWALEGVLEVQALEWHWRDPPSGHKVNGDPCLARVHSKTAKSSRGPSSDDSALLAVFRLAS